MARFDLTKTLRDLATRNPGRSEADIQAMVRDVIVYGGFDLREEAVALESPAEDHRRLDVAVGAVIIECKRDIRAPAQLARSERQLLDYLAAKARGGGKYAGVLTDGAIWRLYRHAMSGTGFVDELTLSPARIDERAFRWWLGAILATERKLKPTATALEERLGASAPSFRLVRAALLECWDATHQIPAVGLKRELWAKLLRSALGSQFEDSDELFIEHTYLVLLATLIAHGVAGFDLDASGHSPGVLVSGQLFERAGLLGVGQAGFFDWVLDAQEGAAVILDLVRRVGSFDWSEVDHDVLKALYQSVIAPEVRKRLGEYYTPDWLAERIIDQVITKPASSRVLDPACGSGTFLFHAVRRQLDATTVADVPMEEALERVTTSVFGVDLHPVAVALAQTTYLLAIGRDRLAQRADVLSIPVYLGDSMRWEAADESMFSPAGDVVLYTTSTDQPQLFATEIRFPAAVVADVGRFDHLVNELARRASTRQAGGSRPSIRGLLRRAHVAENDEPIVEATYKVLCDLHDAGLNHIWAYYVRNQSRPTWLARPENRVDALIGNPPWLAYRFMPKAMQEVFERRSRERHLWLGGGRGRTTQQDLSAFFVARAIELYLRLDGTFGFVMPRAVLSRQTYAGFRAGAYSNAGEECQVAFDTAWELENVKPDPFPVPSAVVFGHRARKPTPLPTHVKSWSGRAPTHSKPGTLTSADSQIQVAIGGAGASPYKKKFRQGAILAPRMLLFVTDAPTSPVGVPVGRRAVRSRKTSLDKAPWKGLPAQEGIVETIFIRPVFLGESIAPFRVLNVPEAVIPYDGTALMDGGDDRIDRYPGLADWWRQAEVTWLANRSSEKRTLAEQTDYMHQLSAQFPVARWRVAYTASGNTLAAAVVDDRSAVIEHKLYWAPVRSKAEGDYLTAILNAPTLSEFVRPFQSVGAFGARDFDKYLWHAPIPAFNASDPSHSALVELAARARKVAHALNFSAGTGFQAARGRIRRELDAGGISDELDAAVATLLAGNDA